MKMLKTISAIAAATVAASALAVSASATTYKDAVQAAKDAGVQATNVQELSNFLEPNADYFSSDDYDYMISVLNNVRDTYVAPKAQELFGKTPAELTEDEKVEVGKSWSAEDRAAIKSTLVDLGAKYDVEVDVEKLGQENFTVEAKIKPKDSSSSDSNSSSNGSSSSNGGGTQTVITDPVAPTGGEVEGGVSAGVVASAGLAVVLAATGIIVVARKNKE